MARYVMQRLIFLVPTVLFVSLIIFYLMNILPGNVAQMVLIGPGGEGAAKAEDVAKLRAEMGLDRPLPVQYADWMLGVVRLNVGRSLWSHEPVFGELGRRFPLSLELALMSSTIALLIAIPSGVIAAVKRGTWLDYAARVFSLVGLSMPNFWVGTLIILFLVYRFGWTPPLGYSSLLENPWKNLQQLIWPALALGYGEAAIISRMMRSSLLEVLREDYVRTARAKGLGDQSVVIRHGIRNALLPVVTLASIQFGYILGGTVIMESVFSLPGVGRYLVDAIAHRDLPVVQTLVLLFALIFIFINLLTDIIYTKLDPRIRLA